MCGGGIFAADMWGGLADAPSLWKYWRSPYSYWNSNPIWYVCSVDKECKLLDKTFNY